MTTMRAAVLANFTDVVRQLGLLPDVQLRAVGLTPQMLATPDRLIPGDAAVRLLERVAEHSGCDVVGLRLSESRGISQFGVVSLLLSQQRTLREVLQMAFKYLSLMNASLALRLEEQGDMALMREEVLTDSGLPSRQAIELAIATNLTLFRAIAGKDWRPTRVYFTHAAPQSLELHQRLFRCPCVFNAEYNAISFPRRDLERRNPGADPRMADYALGFVESVADADAEPVVAEVRRLIYLLLPLGQASVKQAAQSLGCSVRKLQLDLGRVGTSFGQLLEAARHERVQLYLRNPRFEIGQIAALLGYRHQSSFSRWYVHRFGSMPSEQRVRPAAREGARPA